MARPRVLTPEKKASILEVISAGCSRVDAADYVGVATSTIANEANRDPEFLDAQKRAEVESKMHHLKRIHAGVDKWQSSAWFLERKWPEEWGRRAPEGRGGEATELLLNILSGANQRRVQN